MISYRYIFISVCWVFFLSVPISGLDLQDWPTVYVTEDMSELDILMDVGYYIQIMDQSPIKVSQDLFALDPYHTYTGCKTTMIESNFWAQLFAEAAAVSPAGGLWTATVEPDHVPPGTTSIQICVTGENVRIEKLYGGAQKVKVAQVVIKVLPL